MQSEHIFLCDCRYRLRELECEDPIQGWPCRLCIKRRGPFVYSGVERFTKSIIMSKRPFLFCSSLLLVLVASIGVDRLTGLFVSSHEQGLIFPRNVTRHFQTPEFSFTITTNALGFRDRDFSQSKTARTRIVALGDSFTYGWGVEAEESWPKALEQRLRSSGLDVEVANLGKPGASPRDYADIAEKSISLLRPDVVIVGVLQGDDLAQMDLPPPPAPRLVSPPNVRTRHERLRRIAGW